VPASDDAVFAWAIGQAFAPRSKSQLIVSFIALLLLGGALGCEGFFVDPTLQTIVITPATPSIPVGQTLQFTSTGIYDDGSNKNISGKTDTIWNVNPANIATVSATGLLTGSTSGSATVSASNGIVSGSTTITVSLPDVTSITVTPSSHTMTTGQSTCFAAIATFAGGQQPQDISQTATWTVNVSGSATPEVSGITQSACTTGTGRQFTAQTPYLPAKPPNLLLDITASYPGLNGAVTSNISKLAITQ